MGLDGEVDGGVPRIVPGSAYENVKRVIGTEV